MRQATPFDVAVVGAGPAGAAAAVSALGVRPASRVLLLDRARFPRDKTCGDGIGPDGVAVLERLGARTVLDGAARIDRLRLSTAGGAAAEGRVRREGFVLPRIVLDARLVALAVERGATLVHERVTSVHQDRDGVVLNGRYRARAVVAADGAHSAVRRQVGAGAHARRFLAVSLRGYAPAPGAPLQLDFRLPREPWPAYAWSFPNGSGEANVGVVVLDGRVRVDRAQLNGILAGAYPELAPRPCTVRGFALPLSPGRPALVHGRVLLAGDAAGLVNPLSGEGIATALLSGMLAGGSAVTRPDDPGRAYAAAMAARLGRHLRHTGVLARALADRSLVDSTVAAASSSPAAFAAVAGLTVGTGRITAPLALAVATEHVRRALRR